MEEKMIKFGETFSVSILKWNLDREYHPPNVLDLRTAYKLIVTKAEDMALCGLLQSGSLYLIP